MMPAVSYRFVNDLPGSVDVNHLHMLLAVDREGMTEGWTPSP